MLKHTGITGVALVAALIVTALIASASAQASICLEVSEAKAGKEGQYNNATCTGKPTEHLLEGKWVLIEEITVFKREKLWCAKLRLVLPENISGEDGYYTSSTCETKLAEANKNKSDWTEVVVPESLTKPNILPEASSVKPITGVSSSGTSVFRTGALSVVSKKSKGTYELTSLKLGSFKVEFEESENELLGLKCNGLNDVGTTGLILVAGTFHIRDYKESTVLRTALIFLLAPIHFSCGAVLVIAEGCVAGQLTPENVLTKFLTVNLATIGTDNKITTVLNEENNKEESCALLAGENGGTKKLSTLKTEQILKEWKQGGVEIAVLVMPL